MIDSDEVSELIAAALETYEADILDLKDELDYRDIEISELQQYVEDLEATNENLRNSIQDWERTLKDLVYDIGNV